MNNVEVGDANPPDDVREGASNESPPAGDAGERTVPTAGAPEPAARPGGRRVTGSDIIARAAGFDGSNLARAARLGPWAAAGITGKNSTFELLRRAGVGAFDAAGTKAIRDMVANLDLTGTKAIRDAIARVTAGTRLGQLTSPLLTEYAKSTDALATRVLGAHVDALPKIAHIALADSAFAGWRSALAAQFAVEQMVGDLPEAAGTAALLKDLQRLTGTNARYAEALSSARGVHSVYAARPLGAYRGLLGELATRPSLPNLRLATVAGAGVSGLVASDLLLQEPADVDDLASDITAEVVELWREGPDQARVALFDALCMLDPEIPELLKGAWHEVASPSPGTLVKMASCAVEAVDRSLRAAASDDDIAAWLAANGGKRKDFYTADGRVTRAGRIRFVARGRGDRRLAVELEKAIVVSFDELNGRLQGAKHASTGDRAAVRSYIVATEALLTQLFVR